MKKKVMYKDIAEMLGKSEQTIKGWKNRFPVLLEVVKLGALCKVNDLDEEKIIKLSELQEMLKDQVDK